MDTEDVQPAPNIDHLLSNIGRTGLLGEASGEHAASSSLCSNCADPKLMLPSVQSWEKEIPFYCVNTCHFYIISRKLFKYTIFVKFFNNMLIVILWSVTLLVWSQTAAFLTWMKFLVGSLSQFKARIPCPPTELERSIRNEPPLALGVFLCLKACLSSFCWPLFSPCCSSYTFSVRFCISFS